MGDANQGRALKCSHGLGADVTPCERTCSKDSAGRQNSDWTCQNSIRLFVSYRVGSRHTQQVLAAGRCRNEMTSPRHASVKSVFIPSL